MSAIEIKVPAGDEGWGDYDGFWTLFNLRIGSESQQQNFRFVPSTSSFTTWLMNYGTCNFNNATLDRRPLFPRDPLECSADRGIGVYQGQQNLGWNSSFSDSYSPLDIESMGLGSSLNPADLYGADYAKNSPVGTDLISIQLTNNSWYQASNETAIFADGTTKFILPTFGLGFGEWVSHLGNAWSFMQSIATSIGIPSRSWGYTAGAHYEPENVGSHGSLVLGGYDNARIRPNSTATFNMSRDTHQLLVNVAAVNLAWNDAPQESYIESFPAVIDSTLPYLMLPEGLCNFFAERYNLVLDAGSGLYFVNSSDASTNSDRTTDISFHLQDALDNSAQTTITFPYKAFNASLHWSWGNSAPRIIFPMKQMARTAVLGRAFLQEAYLFANYEPEKMEFQVSQTAFDNTASEIISVSARTESTSKEILSGGAIAGIVIGGVALLAFIAVAIWWFIFRKKKQRDAETLNGTPQVKGEPFPDMKETGDPRRGTVSSTAWSDVTAGPSEVDATSPGTTSPRRPVHVRNKSQISEMSSDSEHQAAHGLMPTLHEIGGYGNQNTGPGELEASSDWLNVNPTRSPEPTSSSIYSPPTPVPRSSPVSFNPFGPPSPPEDLR